MDKVLEEAGRVAEGGNIRSIGVEKGRDESRQGGAGRPATVTHTHTRAKWPLLGQATDAIDFTVSRERKAATKNCPREAINNVAKYTGLKGKRDLQMLKKSGLPF